MSQAAATLALVNIGGTGRLNDNKIDSLQFIVSRADYDVSKLPLGHSDPSDPHVADPANAEVSRGQESGDGAVGNKRNREGSVQLVPRRGP